MKQLGMVSFRSVVAVVLTVVLAFLILWGSPAEAARTAPKPTYTAAQLEQIQQYVTELEEMSDRLLELPTLVQQEDWVNVKNLIHGPLGELRAVMFRLSRNLLDSKSQKVAQKASREVFKHLVAIDEAADARDATKAFRNYNELLKDLDTFLQLIPT